LAKIGAKIKIKILDKQPINTILTVVLKIILLLIKFPALTWREEFESIICPKGIPNIAMGSKTIFKLRAILPATLLPKRNMNAKTRKLDVMLSNSCEITFQ
jgi:hypothetical protein